MSNMLLAKMLYPVAAPDVFGKRLSSAAGNYKTKGEAYGDENGNGAQAVRRTFPIGWGSRI
jgi:hypothetical protein